MDTCILSKRDQIGLTWRWITDIELAAFAVKKIDRRARCERI